MSLSPESMDHGDDSRSGAEKELLPFGNDTGEKEKILVHACCASCASYVLEYLSGRYDVTAFYFNPNIQPESEYTLRLGEMDKVCRGLGIPMIDGGYRPELWDEQVRPFRDLPEKSERCWTCYRYRFEETARVAAAKGFGIFTSTLSVSPHKIHARIIEEGEKAAARHGIGFLTEDFKKKDGFRLSVEKSIELGLTRQDYCGCLYSLAEARARRSRDK
ncbi:MAG TPA: epoxyqueuosine reductase QueH [Candidatus Krumholzibacterium sp.]|nr:epoxyqueuosine reductase QueH [Candidatus Krumholzibacterium sp.]